MHLSHAALISTLVFAPILLCGQAETPSPQAPVAAAAPATPSTLLQPALATVQSTLASLKLDKWKKGSVRDEAGSNVEAMLRDLKSNVPALVSDADATPGSVSKSLPLIKHLDALYDVFLRVEEASRVSAPADQIDLLEQTLKTFGTARIAFYDSLQQSAAGQEKQISDLQATVKAHQSAVQEAKPLPAAAPCTPPKPTVKKKRAAPAKPPATTPPTATPPAAKPPAAPKTP